MQVVRKRHPLVSLARDATHPPDSVIIALVLILLVFGLIMIFDASIYTAEQYLNDRFHFVVLQVAWIVLGICAAALFYFLDYHRLGKLAVPMMIGTIILLILVLIPHIGKEVNGANRWITIGTIDIQPAELLKVSLVVYLSTWLSKVRKNFSSFREAIRYHFVYELLVFLVLLGVVGGLVVFEPDLGTTVIVCTIAFAVYFASGRDLIHTLGSGLIVVMASLLGVVAVILESYRLERVQTFIELLTTGTVSDPTGTGYQLQQILIGVGSGGFWGKGFGESRQRYGYLVENTAATDSIFAIILEELGMIGGVILISLFLVLLWRAYQIAVHAPDRLGQLLAGGIGFWLAFQAFLNMAANVALIPVTGVPLPFISYGGSSTIVAMMGIGILLNVSRHISTGSTRTKPARVSLRA